ncbi:hypothetical protein Trydic_g13454, partial [Trypoxylus dichotomus]
QLSSSSVTQTPRPPARTASVAACDGQRPLDCPTLASEMAPGGPSQQVEALKQRSTTHEA